MFNHYFNGVSYTAESSMLSLAAISHIVLNERPGLYLLKIKSMLFDNIIICEKRDNIFKEQKKVGKREGVEQQRGNDNEKSLLCVLPVLNLHKVRFR